MSSPVTRAWKRRTYQKTSRPASGTCATSPPSRRRAARWRTWSTACSSCIASATSRTPYGSRPEPKSLVGHEPQRRFHGAVSRLSQPFLDHLLDLREGQREAVIAVDGQGDEGETTALQIVAHGIGLSSASRDIPYGSPAVLDRAAVDEAPLVGVEASELLLQVEKRLGVLDRRFNLGPVAHDPRICQKRGDLPFVVAGDLPRVEPVERAPVGVPLAQDRAPAQPRLGTLEDEKLKKDAIVVQGNAPLLVVVGDVQRVGACPAPA